MAYNTRKMLEDSNGDLIPQYFNQSDDIYEHLRGEQGVQFTGNHVLTESGIWVPQKGSDDGAADVRLTGSIVDTLNVRKEEVIINRQIRTASTAYTQIDFPQGAKNVILFLRVYGVTGAFGSDEGINLEAGLSSPNSISYIGTATRTPKSTSSNIHFAITDIVSHSENPRIVVSTLLFPRFTYRIEITGTFSSGEGVDCDVVAVWVS